MKKNRSANLRLKGCLCIKLIDDIDRDSPQNPMGKRGPEVWMRIALFAGEVDDRNAPIGDSIPSDIPPGIPASGPVHIVALTSDIRNEL